jgi:2-polyprenyl-3-methyl-5-hydroxy-6-metoxy-1,4-benzoquinol methylase
MSKMNEQVKRLREIWGGFRSARVLITANNYRIFDYLTEPQSARAISHQLKTDLRATEILLDALTGLELLKKSADEYRNTSLSNLFLVKGAPYYQGDIIRHADYLWKNWSALDEVVRTGNPSRGVRDYESFILGMHNLAILKARDVIKAVGLKKVRTALDLGGGPGTYSIAMAKQGVQVTLFDHPVAIEIAREIIAKKSTIGINFIKGDFMADDIGGGYDLIFISQIFHSYSADDNLLILKKCAKSLNREGRIVIQEFYISENRARPVQGALFSVNMLVNTQAGRCYFPKEIKDWLSKSGLKNIGEKRMDDTVLIMGGY